jgi:hypothetical protein
MIDPQVQGKSWLKSLEKDNDLKVKPIDISAIHAFDIGHW